MGSWFKPKEKCLFECDSTYSFGQSTRTKVEYQCQLDGTWKFMGEGEEPTCTNDCSLKNKIPANAFWCPTHNFRKDGKCRKNGAFDMNLWEDSIEYEESIMIYCINGYEF